MRFVAAALVALGFSHGALGDSVECADKAECSASADDPSLIQLAGINNRIKQPEEGTGSPTTSLGNSKPFMVPPGGLLKESQQGKLIINEDGVENTYYLPGAPTQDGGKTVKYEPPYRYYLMKTPTTDYSNKDNFYRPNWIGKTFSVDFNFGPNGASCGCNINFYLVDMPVTDPGKDGDHYCDAQCFPDMGCCPEFDMNEGNNEVQQITNHACTGDYANHPDWACNKWGDPELKTHPSDFSPGAGHTIDSTKPFTWMQVFEKGGSEFTFTTMMKQEGRTVTLKMGPGNSQLNSMMGVIEKGMAFVTGYWFAPDMNWLDGDECGQGAENCNKAPVYLSNWRITTNGDPIPSPPPGPPAPPGPAPPPAPPSPPAGSKCCWGGCGTGCDDNPSAWCNQGGGANCESSCGGQWC